MFFLFVLMMFQFFRLSDFFVVHNVSGGSVISLMAYLALTFTPIIFPIAFLLAVLMGFGRLSGDSEVMAMRASGISIYSLLLPVFCLGVIIASITMFCNLYFVPYGAKSFRYELFRISNTKAIATIHGGTFTEGFFDLVLYADEVDTRANTMKKVLIYDEKDKGAPTTVIAKRGRIINNLKNAEGTPGLLLRLFDGSLHRGDTDKNVYEKTTFDVYDIFLKIETAKVIGVEIPKTMDIGVLKKRMDELNEKQKTLIPPQKLAENERLDLINFSVEYWKRYAVSFSCILFSVLGVGFGVVRTRTVRSNSFLICIFVLLLYWVLYTLGHNWASDGKIPAFIGMWGSNFVLLIVAIITIRRVAK